MVKAQKVCEFKMFCFSLWVAHINTVLVLDPKRDTQHNCRLLSRFVTERSNSRSRRRENPKYHATSNYSRLNQNFTTVLKRKVFI